jgi:hypothetical protein
MPSKIISSYGELWKISDANLKKLLIAVADGKTVDFGSYAKSLGIVSFNFTDLDQEMAKELLGDLDL